VIGTVFVFANKLSGSEEGSLEGSEDGSLDGDGGGSIYSKTFIFPDPVFAPTATILPSPDTVTAFPSAVIVDPSCVNVFVLISLSYTITFTPSPCVPTAKIFPSADKENNLPNPSFSPPLRSLPICS